MTQDTARNAGYDDFLDAIATGDGYYLECANGHGWLPPRQVCPTCSTREFTRESLPDKGVIKAASTVYVAAPQFSDDTPYTVVLATFGPVTLTGQLSGVSPEDIEAGLTVEPTVVESQTTGDRLLGFTPV